MPLPKPPPWVRSTGLIDPALVRRAIGRRIAELRQEREWTQAKLSEKMNWFPQYTSRVELGHENFRVSTLAEIANAFQVDIRDLFVPPKSPLPMDEEPPRGRPRKGAKKVAPFSRQQPKAKPKRSRSARAP